MKCKNSDCGAEISDSTRFCEFCGSATETNTTRACPKCSSVVTKGQRFCADCGWKVDPSIFEVRKLLCVGKNEDGTACRAELVPGVKFCSECGSNQSRDSLTYNDKKMKCKNSDCGAEISDSTRFCEFCGSATETNTTRACPKCSSVVTKGQRFCADCGWKVDPSIFEVRKLLCVGKNDDGTACRAELVPGVKFCPECGSNQSRASVYIEGQPSSHPQGHSNCGSSYAQGHRSPGSSYPQGHSNCGSSYAQGYCNHGSSYTQGHVSPGSSYPQCHSCYGSSYPQGYSSSGSSSCSDSPDAWRLPGRLAATNIDISEVEETVDSDFLSTQNDEQNNSSDGRCDDEKVIVKTETDEGGQENVSKTTKKKGKKEKVKPTHTKPYEGADTVANVDTSSSEDGKSSVASGTTVSSHADAVSSNLRSGGNQRTKQFVEVHFHCILAPTMYRDLSKDKLYVTFESSTLGGWKARKYLMKCVRTMTKDFVELEGVVYIPRHMLYQGRILYNYVMVHRIARGETFEFVGRIKKGKSIGRGLTRSLNIKTHELVNESYHSYDGVVRENPRFNKRLHFKEDFGFDDYDKVLINDAVLSAKTFQPTWQIKSFSSDGINGEDLIKHVTFVADGLTDVYCRQASLWLSHDSYKMIVYPIISSELKKLNTTADLTCESQTLHIVTAITIARLFKIFNITLKNWSINALCEAFLPKKLNNGEVQCDLDAILSFFKTSKKEAAGDVLDLLSNIAREYSHPCWLYGLPVLHFLQGKCIPFEIASGDTNHNSFCCDWWGISDLRLYSYCSKFKTSLGFESHGAVLKKLEPYLQMDYYLARAFMAVLKLEDIPEIVNMGLIPTDVILASIVYHIKESFSYKKEVIESCLKSVFNTVKKQLTQGDRKDKSFAGAWRCCKISGDVLEESMMFNKNFVFTTPAVEVFLICLYNYDQVQADVDWNLKEIKDIKVSKDSHTKMFIRLRDRYCKYLTMQSYYKERSAYLEKWNAALKVEVPDCGFKDSYLKYMEDALQDQLNKNNWSPDKELIRMYVIQNEAFENSIQAMLGNIALNAIQRYRFDMEMIIGDDDRLCLRLGDLISNILHRSWEKSKQSDPEHILEHVITWPSFPTFIEMFYKCSKYLKGESLTLLDSAINVLSEIIVKIHQGAIGLRDLKKISDNRRSFHMIVQAIKDVDLKLTMLALDLRLKELKAYIDTSKSVKEFTNYCIHCKANTEEMGNKLRQLEHQESLQLDQLVKVEPFDPATNIDNYHPFVTVFELSKDQLDTIPDILECSKGLLFTKLWEARGTEVQKIQRRRITLLEVFEHVWEPTANQWTTLSRKLIRGDLPFSEFQIYFKTTNIENLRNELLLLDKGGATKWVDERIEQVQNYRDMKSCESGATAIIELIKAFDLKGDFNQMKEICLFTKGKDTSMNKLDKLLSMTCDILREVTKEQNA